MPGLTETEQTTSLLQFSLIEPVTEGGEPACLGGARVRRYRDFGPSEVAGSETLRKFLLLSFTGLLMVSDRRAVKPRNQFAPCATCQMRRRSGNSGDTQANSDV